MDYNTPFDGLRSVIDFTWGLVSWGLAGCVGASNTYASDGANAVINMSYFPVLSGRVYFSISTYSTDFSVINSRLAARSPLHHRVIRFGMDHIRH